VLHLTSGHHTSACHFLFLLSILHNYLLTYFPSLSLQPKKLVEAKKKKQKKYTHTHTHTQLDLFFFFFFTQLQEQNQNPKNKKNLLLALDNEELDDQET
jgi:hypothetical protein